jgi:hypothetical protein
MPFLFENLLVYQKALDFADEVCQFTSRFDRGFGFLADQLNRASLSISTNLAEGNGRFTPADRRTQEKGVRNRFGKNSFSVPDTFSYPEGYMEWHRADIYTP